MKIKSTVALIAIIIMSLVGGFAAQHTTQVSAGGQPQSGYIATFPSRIYDSRGPAATNDRLAGGQQVTVSTGYAGSTAVGVNITLTDTTGPGFVTAWASGPRPTTSVINTTSAGENIANFLIIPVAADGTFQMFTQIPVHIIVDVMGHFDTIGAAGSVGPQGPTGPTGPVGPQGAQGPVLVVSPPPVPGVTAQITGYVKGSSYTEVLGTATNNSGATVYIRITVAFPSGSLDAATVSIPNGQTKGWDVYDWDHAFSSGATITQIVLI